MRMRRLAQRHHNLLSAGWCALFAPATRTREVRQQVGQQRTVKMRKHCASGCVGLRSAVTMRRSTAFSARRPVVATRAELAACRQQAEHISFMC